MHTHVILCMCTYMCVCVCTYMCVHVFARVCFVRECACVWHEHMCVCVCVCVHARACALHVHMCVCAYNTDWHTPSGRLIGVPARRWPSLQWPLLLSSLHLSSLNAFQVFSNEREGLCHWHNAVHVLSLKSGREAAVLLWRVPGGRRGWLGSSPRWGACPRALSPAPREGRPVPASQGITKGGRVPRADRWHGESAEPEDPAGWVSGKAASGSTAAWEQHPPDKGQGPVPSHPPRA